MIDEEVRAIIEHGYVRATQVLTEYKAKLLALADKLIAEETVDAEGFESLFEDVPAKQNLHGILMASDSGSFGAPTKGPSAPPAGSPRSSATKRNSPPSTN